MITFRCYGTWLHGDARGSMDRRHNEFGTPPRPADERAERTARAKMRDKPHVLESPARDVVEAALSDVCLHREWMLHAVNVRTNHVHALVTANVKPEKVLSDFKAWSTRRLREAGLAGPDARVWSFHGSTKYVWDEAGYAACWEYVVNGQGAPLP